MPNGNLDRSQQRDAGIVARQSIEQWSGPLPPPKYLEEFNRVVPGAAERILAQFEKQASHRMDVESRVVRSKVLQSHLGAVFGFVIGIVGLWIARDVAINGYGAVAMVIASLDIVGLASVFVLGRRYEQEERKQRRVERQSVVGRPS